MKIAIDAGHGPQTAGKRSPDGSLREFSFNAAVADKLKARLLKYEGVEVYFTHSNARDVPLKERVYNANVKIKANLFLSIHANAYGNDWNAAEGIETHIYKTEPAAAKNLGIVIQKELLRFTHRQNRGLKASDFYVLKNTACTAVLVECGFMTNRTECHLLKTNEYRDIIAQALEQAIVKHYALKEKKPGVKGLIEEVIEEVKDLFTE